MLILYPFLAAALSEEKDCYKAVDEIYYKNKQKYIKAFEEDKKANDKALKINDRVLAAYETVEGKIWIITEWDRSYTTILFPDEY